MSSSYPHLPLDNKYFKLPGSFQISSQREKAIDSMLPRVSSSGHLFSSSSRPTDSTDSHISSVSHCSHNSSFIFKLPVDENSLSLPHSSHSEVQSTAMINFPRESKDMPRCSDSLQDFFHFSENVSDQNGLVDSSAGVITSEDHTGNTDWSVWDSLMSFDDALDPNWELPIDVDQVDPKSKVLNPYSDMLVQQPQIQQHQPIPSTEFRPSPEPLSTAPTTKPRMRWTQELHESFVEAVSQLGGSERATPKGILNHMKVEGLTIYHVKSHLQKYRTARYKPESPEGTCAKVSTLDEETNSLDLKSGMGITEALRLQVELQKRLHEQLENQRKLQLQIEEQGKYLEKMFEQQRKMEDDKVKSTPSLLDDHPTPLSNVVCPSSGEDKPETSKHDEDKTAITASNAGAHLEETEDHEDVVHLGDVESGAPPTKRARNG